MPSKPENGNGDSIRKKKSIKNVFPGGGHKFTFCLKIKQKTPILPTHWATFDPMGCYDFCSTFTHPLGTHPLGFTHWVLATFTHPLGYMEHRFPIPIGSRKPIGFNPLGINCCSASCPLGHVNPVGSGYFDAETHWVQGECDPMGRHPMGSM